MIIGVAYLDNLSEFELPLVIYLKDFRGNFPHLLFHFHHVILAFPHVILSFHYLKFLFSYDPMSFSIADNYRMNLKH